MPVGVQVDGAGVDVQPERLAVVREPDGGHRAALQANPDQVAPDLTKDIKSQFSATTL